MSAERLTSRSAPWAWGAMSTAAWIASFFVAFGVMAGAGTLGLLPSDLGGLRADLAVFLALFGIIAAAGAIGAGRLAFGRWPAVRAQDALVPLIGLALAVAVELALHEWADARFGYYDAEMVWWTAGLSITMVALAVATFAAVIAPRGSALPPLLAQVVAATVVGLIVLSNVGGITDGIEPASWPLAVLVGSCGLYAAVVVAIGTRRVSAG